MNINFSLKRIQLLLKADWTVYKNSFLFSMGVLLLAWFFILFVITSNFKIADQGGCFAMGGIIVFIIFCRHAGRKVHKTMSRYYTLPASTAEKYVSLLLEGLVLALCYFAIFYGGLLAKKLAMPALDVITPAEFFTHNGSESGLLMVSSLIFLSYMTFRKHAFLIAITGLMAYVGLFMGAIVQTFRYISLNTMPLGSSFMYDTFRVIGDYYFPVMLVSFLAIMYVAYLKLKEKESR